MPKQLNQNPMTTSFGSTSFGSFPNPLLTQGGPTAGGGLKLHTGITNTTNITHNITNDDASLVSRSEHQNQFKMGMNNDDTLSGLVGLDNTDQKNNETKMSDNEAFMAYMSKAEAGDDEDDD